jgi:hypothetical protein
MEKPSPTMQRVLRQAYLYGYLVEHEGKLYHPGARSAICSQTKAAAMVREGWLKYIKPQYYITAAGRIAIQG